MQGGLTRVRTSRPLPSGDYVMPTLRDRIFNWRNRLLADSRFQDWASRTPFVKKMAQKESRAAFDLCAGFVYSQVLLACVKLKLFDVLEDGPLAVSAIAPRIDLTPDATLRLLKAATALRLTERRSENRFGLGMVGAAMRANPGVLVMVEHHEMVYGDLKDPVALLKGRAPVAALNEFWGYARADGSGLKSEQVSRYTHLMAESNAIVAGHILDAYDFSQHRVYLDVGGGDGTFIRRVAALHPKLDCMMFELPAVADQARLKMQSNGLDSRIGVFGGSFLSDQLPTGADLITLVRIIHDHDEQPVRQILRAARTALAPGGTLLIAEPMAETAGAETVGDAYFGFYLMAMGSGEPRTHATITGLLTDAGFNFVREIPTRLPGQVRVLIARG